MATDITEGCNRPLMRSTTSSGRVPLLANWSRPSPANITPLASCILGYTGFVAPTVSASQTLISRPNAVIADLHHRQVISLVIAIILMPFVA